MQHEIRREYNRDNVLGNYMLQGSFRRIMREMELNPDKIYTTKEGIKFRAISVDYSEDLITNKYIFRLVVDIIDSKDYDFSNQVKLLEENLHLL